MAEEGKDIKGELDAAEFLEDSGLLFEINRLVLHPIGYHMGIPVVDGKRTLRVLDYADVEGGVAFGAIEWKDGREKQKAFNKKREVVRRISDRMRSLGCIVQEAKIRQSVEKVRRDGVRITSGRWGVARKGSRWKTVERGPNACCCPLGAAILCEQPSASDPCDQYSRAVQKITGASEFWVSGFLVGFDGGMEEHRFTGDMKDGFLLGKTLRGEYITSQNKGEPHGN
jgi:hypothetical protein